MADGRDEMHDRIAVRQIVIWRSGHSQVVQAGETFRFTPEEVAVLSTMKPPRVKEVPPEAKPDDAPEAQEARPAPAQAAAPTAPPRPPQG